MHFDEVDIDGLLDAYQRLRRRPTRQPGNAVIEGFIPFKASSSEKPTITDEYRIRLEVSLTPSSVQPKAYEVGGRIPVHADNHVNHGGDLCLGSPLGILKTVGPKPTLLTFVEKCIVPFLYAASWRERGFPGFPFDELAHGAAGLVADYERLFSVVGRDNVARVLLLLAKRKRIANKMLCPCGCGLRLAKCKLHALLAPFRRLAPRSFYLGQRQIILKTEGSTTLSSERATRPQVTVRSACDATKFAAWPGESSILRLK